MEKTIKKKKKKKKKESNSLLLFNLLRAPVFQSTF